MFSLPSSNTDNSCLTKLIRVPTNEIHAAQRLILLKNNSLILTNLIHVKKKLLSF